MSVENAIAFLEQASQDPSLQDKLKAIPTEEMDAAVAQVVTLAADSGFSFTGEHWQAAIKSFRSKEDGELEPFELDRITGRGFATIFEQSPIRPDSSGPK